MSSSSQVALGGVEKAFLERSGRQLIYAPQEHVPIIEVANFPQLGKLAALRFLEWAGENPEGVVALPTGKTPETFIHWTRRLLDLWSDPEVRADREACGLTAASPPRLDGLRFVQIDEFYPIDTRQENSFHHYVHRFYFGELGLSADRAQVIDPNVIGIPRGMTLRDVYPDGLADLSLRFRPPANAQERLQAEVIRRVDEFCDQYESAIRAKGGIGFFLGGIGPDGHVAFNCRGSSHHSTTRLTELNYETQAAAATDLGGIEVTRGRLAITIGLETITWNPDATVLVIAAGEAKAAVVAQAITGRPGPDFPASAIARLPGARFYLTRGAAVELVPRRLADLLTADNLAPETVERAVIDLCCSQGRTLEELSSADFEQDPFAAEVLRRSNRTHRELADLVRASLEDKIRRGLSVPEGKTILHTGPHHDDIMLGYMPHVMHLVRKADNLNEFLILTSGFTSVTNNYVATGLREALAILRQGGFDREIEAGSLDPADATARSAEVFEYLDGIAARDSAMCANARSSRLLSNLVEVFGFPPTDLGRLDASVEETLDYFARVYPGKKDMPEIQKLKGMQREWEEELVWGYVGINRHHVKAARLGFYTGDIFTPQPTEERDVAPVLRELERIQPDIVTVALDPEGAGPDTHYKVLQVLNAALQLHGERGGKSPEVWGYRNVWYRFHPAEASLFVPATLNTMAIMENAFMKCFGSQKDASFPSWEYDGPFCDLARRIWIDQFKMIQTCLGERYFPENPHPRLRAAHGVVFLMALSMDEFSGKARSLRKATEGV